MGPGVGYREEFRSRVVKSSVRLPILLFYPYRAADALKPLSSKGFPFLPATSRSLPPRLASSSDRGTGSPSLATFFFQKVA